MALLYTDGFDLQDTLLRWTPGSYVADTVYTTATRFGSGKCITLNVGSSGSQNTATIIKGFPASATVYAGAAILLSADNGGNEPTQNLFGLYTDGGTSPQIYLRRLSASGSLVLMRGDANQGSYNSPNGTQLAASSANAIDNNWHYIEMSATINATTGSVTVKVDGTTVLTFTGNTKNGGISTNIDGIRFRTGRYLSDPIGRISIDDLYICDGTGTVNNTFLGDVKVQSMVPNAAGSSTQLTPTGSVNNYVNVGEVPYNDATYNASSTVGQRDTYKMTSLVAGTTTIFGTQSVAHMQKSDAGTANAKVALKSGVSVYYDTTQSLGTTATTYTQVRETDPATSAAWTVASANALEAGMEVA